MSKSDEIKNIIDALGRSDLTEGNVRGIHLGKILTYLQMKKTEKYNDTLYKLALILGMNIRYVRENYLKGLELFGIIKVKNVNHDLIWSWIGEKGLDINLHYNNGSDEPETESFEEHVKKNPHKKEKSD